MITVCDPEMPYCFELGVCSRITGDVTIFMFACDVSDLVTDQVAEFKPSQNHLEQEILSTLLSTGRSQEMDQ